MTREEILQALRRFVLEQTGLSDPSALDNDANLFQSGLLDSMMAVSLVVFCEQEFSCQLDTLELTPENFSTLNAMTNLICRKLECQPKV